MNENVQKATVWAWAETNRLLKERAEELRRQASALDGAAELIRAMDKPLA